MKMFKKLSVMFVAAAMMMTTVSTAFAADSKVEGNGTITINRDGANYDAYKVLDSTTKTTGGKNIAVYTVNKDYEAFFTNTGYTFVADEGILLNGAKVVSTDELRKANDTAEYKQSDAMKALSKALIEYSADKTIAPAYNLGSTATTVKQGYYLVLENSNTITDKNENTGRVPSQAMLMKVENGNNINIFPKDSEFTIDKKVNNADSSVGGVGVEQEFKITSTIPTYADNFKTVKYNVIDTMSKGLTLNEDSIVVKVNGAVAKDAYFTRTTAKNDKNETVTTFTFNYDALRTDAKMGATVEITYKAVINEDAVVFDANTNTAKVVYTTTPDGKDSGIEDKTNTYTYAIDLVKKDGSNKNKVLKGAEFEIKNAAGEVLQTVISDENGKIHFTGLAEGIYSLRETKTPSNDYAVLDGEIKFEIKANDDKASCTVAIIDGDASITNDATANNGVITFEIYNYKGISLPETGGMGTTVFMIGGAALIAMAGVMLVVYSKKSKKA